MVKLNKKLMLLGGLRYLLPVINVAQKLGVKVITVDYLPNNIAHKFSDEYYNISIIEKDSVLKLAQNLRIDGIMSFAVDPGVLTAAYVAEKMHLPFQGSLESVIILQNKFLFRNFLKNNGFNVPKAKGYNKYSIKEALDEDWNYPIIVKPVDSAGSKGVTKVNNIREIKTAIEIALSESISKHFIIEEFIEAKGYPSDSDCFIVNGDLIFCSFSNQYFDETAKNPFTPAAFSWPSTMPIQYQQKLQEELQRLFKLLQMRTGIFNVETRVGKNGKTYIMEVSPRGGGNRLAEMIDKIEGTPLIENSVRASVGLPLLKFEPKYKGSLIEIILHSSKNGIFEEVQIDSDMKKYLIESDIWIKPGETVSQFTGANASIGTLIFEIFDESTLNQLHDKLFKKINVIIK